jgi:AcrR family transcriptional regulator
MTAAPREDRQRDRFGVAGPGPPWSTAVADRAGVTRRAVYMHFANRSALVAELFAHVAEAEGLAESPRNVSIAPARSSWMRSWRDDRRCRGSCTAELDVGAAHGATSGPSVVLRRLVDDARGVEGLRDIGR